MPSALSSSCAGGYTCTHFIIALILAVVLHLNGLRFGCAGDTFRIGRRTPGDRVVLKKVLLSVPSNVPTNHTIIYEYRATEAVSCIEYQVADVATTATNDAGNASFPSRCSADIAFTGEYSLAATFHLVNITELVIVMSIYGFDQFSVPLDFRPILVPQFLRSADGGAPKFGLGFRQHADELVYFYTQQTTRTTAARNHSLVFEAILAEHYITYVSFAVDSKTAGVTFLQLSEHEFRGMVYDTQAHILFANLYVYGYKKDKLPPEYVSLLPVPTVFSSSTAATLRNGPDWTENAATDHNDDNAASPMAYSLEQNVLLMLLLFALSP